MTTTTQRSIRGATDNKRLGAYLKKSHKTEDIYVETSEECYISDRYILVRTLPVAEVKAFFPENLEKAWYEANNLTAQETHASMKDGWDMFQKYSVIAELQASRYLYEIPQSKRASDFYRKLVTKDEQKRIIWVNRSMLDIFSPDPDNLDDFLLELMDDGRKGMVRVSARYGHVAFLMPLSHIER